MVAVEVTVRAAVDATRGGGGPRFIHCHTDPLHVAAASDPAVYRQKREVDEAWKNDPIERCAAVLREAGVGADVLDAHRDAAAFEMDQAYETAKAAPWPDLSLAYTDVQDIGDPRERSFC